MTGVVVSVEEYGAVGDGVSDDTAAIRAAVLAAAQFRAATVALTHRAEPATVLFTPNSVHAVSGRINGVSDVNIWGNGATLRWVGTSRERLLFFNAVSRIQVSDLTIEAAGTAPQAMIFASNSDRLTFDGVRLTSSGTKEVGIRLSGCTNSNIIGCAVQGFSTAYNINGASSDCQIRNSEAAGTLAGVLINSLNKAAPRDIDVIGVTVTEFPSQSGYAIRAAGTTAASLRRIRFIGCTVIGPGRSWADPKTPGTADQINAVHTLGFSVIGCTSMYGGDMGMSFTYCTNVTVSGNLSAFNNTAGIIGARSDIVTITGNTCLNNGQNFIGAKRRPSVFFGIGAHDARDVNIVGNMLGDNQSTPTQNYGVSVAASLTGDKSITVGPNTYSGNALARFYVLARSTNVTNLDVTLAADAAGKRARYSAVTAPAVEALPGPSRWTALVGAPSITLPNDGASYRIDVRANAAVRSVADRLTFAISADGGSTMLDTSTLRRATVDAQRRASLTMSTVRGSGQTISLWVSGSAAASTSLVVNNGAGACELFATRVR